MIGLLNKIRKFRWAYKGRLKIRELVKQKHDRNQPVKVILGAGNYSAFTNEWINTDLPQFDITNASHWEFIFGNVKISNLFAEHVFEHLTKEQIIMALTLAHKYMSDTGVFRIAIPDRNNKDSLYQEATKPGGTGPGADDHKVFLNIHDCEELAKATSFRILPLEYFDNDSSFHFVDFDSDKGDVTRSRKNNYHYEPVPKYTSLIFDLVLK